MLRNMATVYGLREDHCLKGMKKAQMAING